MRRSSLCPIRSSKLPWLAVPPDQLASASGRDRSEPLPRGPPRRRSLPQHDAGRAAAAGDPQGLPPEEILGSPEEARLGVTPKQVPLADGRAEHQVRARTG